MADAMPDPRLFKLTCAGLAAVAAGYLAATAVQLPVGVVAAAGAALLGLLALAARNVQAARVRSHFSFSLLVYVVGLLVMVRGVEAIGLTTVAVGWLVVLAHGPVTSVAAGLAGGAIGANLINNVPATLVLLSGTHGVHPVPFLVGVLAGADLGPNLTPVGSLSTWLWLVIIRPRRRDLVHAVLEARSHGHPGVLLAAGLTIAVTFR